MISFKIVVDWSAGISISYAQSRNRINSVADVGARFVNFLISNAFTNHNSILIAGHSLGGHIAGLIGKRVTGGRLRTIIALDPAGPMFSTGNPTERVDASDA